MRVLIISRCFPPDTSIGGIRPYMFAKYLMRFGHDVTVINSGLVFAKEDKSYEEKLKGMRIISVYKRKTTANNSPKSNDKSWKDKAPQLVKNTYLALREPAIILREKRCFNSLFKEFKRIIEGLRGEHFDVVFSTYSPVADIYAGEFAARFFGCKWIVDFRDALVQPSSRSWLWNAAFRNTQRWAVKTSDACTTVSNGVGRMLSFGIKNANVITLYNGYDASAQFIKGDLSKPLSLCYTGNIYGKRMDAMAELLKAISFLKENHRIELENICINYAGNQSEELRTEMAKYGLESILNNYGYLTVNESEQLQRNSDLFLVLSWNFKNEQGILTGKFFEGIRAYKPMLVSVVGDTPHSELAKLNEEYHYGFCYEDTTPEPMMPKLCDFILEKYNEKLSTGEVSYEQDSRLTEKFKYENLTKELESICKNLLKR